jgi:peroxiredoxin
MGIFLLYAVFLLLSCSESEVDPMNNPPEDDPDNTGMTPPAGEEEVAPDFELESINGDKIKLSDYEGKVVVLFFLGNACPSCKAVAPSIEHELHISYDSYENYEIFGLDQWNGNKSSLEAFKNSTGVTFPLLLMASAVASDYGTTYDRLVVVDKEGKIAFKGSLNANSDIPDVKETVNSLLPE